MAMKPPAGRNPVPSAAPCVALAWALVALYLGERTLVGMAHRLALAMAAALGVAAVGLIAVQLAHARGERRVALGAIARSLAQVGLGVAVYGASQHGATTAWWWPQAAAAGQVLWPALVAWGALTAWAQQQALHSMRHAPTLELWRLRQAHRSARIVGLSLLSFAALNYAATTNNRKVDLSYFRVTQVSGATASRAAALAQPVILSLFFPPGNDVREQARAYAEALAARSPWVRVELLDQALEPERARALKVRQNGTMAVTAANRTELIQLGLDPDDARATLRRLDSEVALRLARVLEPERVVYLTTGHAERDTVPDPHHPVPGLGDFKVLMQSQGFVVRPLGLAEGLGSQIPDDAAVVAIMGPQTPMLPAELAALRAYVARGGRLLVCLDPDRDGDDDDVLAPLGVAVGRTRIANAHYQVRAQNQAQSPYNLVTVRLAGHPSVATLEQNPGRMGVVFLGAAAVAARPGADPNLVLTPTAWAMPDSFADADGDGLGGADVQRSSTYALATAVTWGSAAPTATWGPAALRAIVIGDVDLACDGVLRNPGNSYFMSDAMHWLAGDAHWGGAPVDEDDVPLMHRKEGDAVWFYGICFGVPALVILLGWAASRRDAHRLRAPFAVAPKHKD